MEEEPRPERREGASSGSIRSEGATPPYGLTPQTSGLAIASLVTGLLGLTFAPVAASIAALVTGLIAKSEIREHNGALEGDGLATAGIVLGIVGIVLPILALLFIMITGFWAFSAVGPWETTPGFY